MHYVKQLYVLYIGRYLHNLLTSDLKQKLEAPTAPTVKGSRRCYVQPIDSAVHTGSQLRASSAPIAQRTYKPKKPRRYPAAPQNGRR